MFPKPLYSLAAALLAAQAAHGHYIFSQLIVNDEAIGGDYDYIRKNSNDYQPSFTDEVINSEDLRCNKGALSSSAQTYDAKPGDKIAAKLWYNELIEHPGPGMIYMSKAPGSVSEYMGDGDWFKVWESGPNGPANVDDSWGTWQQDRMEFTVPDDIPDGEYLVRFEHVGIHENHVGKSQFYMECAQIAITGGGDGVPGPLVQIPGVYSAQDPAFTYSIWGGDDGSGYEMPGPAVWTGGASGGSSSSSSGSSSSSSSGSSESSSNSSETEASSSGTSEAPASGSSEAASSGSMEAPSSGSSAPSTGSEAPVDASASQGGNQWEQGGQQGGNPWGQTGGDATAAPAANQNNGGWGGSWAPQNNQGGWGKRDDCAVEYVGGGAARARRSVKA